MFSHINKEPLDETNLKKFEQIDKDLMETKQKLEKINFDNEKLVLLENKLDRFLILEKKVCEKDSLIDGLLQKIHNLEKYVDKQNNDKDKEIRNLVHKVKSLEEKVVDLEEAAIVKLNDTSNVEEPKNMLENTFVNPSSGRKCNFCDFVAKDEIALNTHKGKSHEEMQHKCDSCDLVAKKESELNTHIERHHTEKELKFQLYAIVKSVDFDRTEVRKQVIENLNKHKEIEKVLSVFVDGSNSAPAVYDTDNKLLVEANIKFSSKTANSFENPTIRRKILKSCNLRETKPFRNGRITREEFLTFRSETGWTTYF
jgi:hypothetical protein